MPHTGKCLRLPCFQKLGLKLNGGISPYYLIVDLRKGKPKDIIREIVSIRRENLSADSLAAIDETPQIQKYDGLSSYLLRKAFYTDYLDITELDRFLEGADLGLTAGALTFRSLTDERTPRDLGKRIGQPISKWF